MIEEGRRLPLLNMQSESSSTRNLQNDSPLTRGDNMAGWKAGCGYPESLSIITLTPSMLRR